MGGAGGPHSGSETTMRLVFASSATSASVVSEPFSGDGCLGSEGLGLMT
jgi:hypothetical protein